MYPFGSLGQDEVTYTPNLDIWTGGPIAPISTDPNVPIPMFIPTVKKKKAVVKAPELPADPVYIARVYDAYVEPTQEPKPKPGDKQGAATTTPKSAFPWWLLFGAVGLILKMKG